MAARLALALSGCVAVFCAPADVASKEAVPAPFVSVVAVDLLWSLLNESPGNTTHVNGMLHDACSRGFTFIRFAASTFWPSQMALYQTNASAYWEVLDTVVALAKANGCGLLPSIFWNLFLFSDLSQEPAGALMEPQTSKAYAAMEAYATAMVRRYATEPTIVAWEIGNEWSLIMDLNMSDRTDCCAPGMGTPLHRTSADNVSTDGLMLTMAGLAGAVRAADPLARPVTSGHALPRPAAEHLRESFYSGNQDWTPDSVTQFDANIAAVSAPFDWVSAHLYAGSDNVRWNITDPDSPDMLYYVTSAASLIDKAVYIGEFGDPAPGPRPFTQAMLGLLAQIGTPRATVWVWEFFQYGTQNPAAQFSLLPGRDDAVIAAMQAYNRASSSSVQRI